MSKTSETPASAPSDKTPRKRTARKAPPSKEGLPEATAPVSRYEAFTMAPVDRAALKLAEYNPRIIDADAEARLEQEIKRGLVQPVIWNRRTGNVVGGHQRIARLDSLHQGKPYSLNVAVVDCDEAEEKRLNVALNNPDLMGQYDSTRLEDVLRDLRLADPGQDLLAATGFTPESFEAMRIAPDLYLLPEADLDVKGILEDVEKIQEMKALKGQHKKESQLQAKRDVMRQIVIVLPDSKGMIELRGKILGKLQLPASYSEPYVDAYRLCTALGIAIEDDPAEEEAPPA